MVATASVSASSSFLRITIAKNNTKLKKRKKIRLGCGGGRASVVRDERSKHGSGRNQEREKNGELVDRSEDEGFKSLKFKSLRVNGQWSTVNGIVVGNNCS